MFIEWKRSVLVANFFLELVTKFAVSGKNVGRATFPLNLKNILDEYATEFHEKAI